MKVLIIALAALTVIFSTAASSESKTVVDSGKKVDVSYQEAEGKVILTLKNVLDVELNCFAKIDTSKVSNRKPANLKIFPLEAFQSRTMVIESQLGDVFFKDLEIKCYFK